ncbi:MAG: cyclic nucleotide-binding domain-containing protein [Proteobacteria bacterium]|nr:cyclic nucleotide-binding domain-containing protein [Pseudomonadota bacterium]
MDIETHIRAFVPLQRLPRPLQDRAVQLAEVRSYSRGQVVYPQGHVDDLVYYLLAGTIELIYHGKITRTLSATHKAALRPLDPPGRKRYSVRAVDNAKLVIFRRNMLDRLVSEADVAGQNVSDELEVSEIATARSSDWMIRMLQSELFSVLPATNIQRIFAHMEQVSCKADQVVVQQGAAGDYYYVIESGYCEVSRSIAGGRGQIHLADLGPGMAFGEEALIANRPRNATVTMLSDGQLMRLGKQDFVELILSKVLQPVGFTAARAEVGDGGVWLDIRYPEDHASGALMGSENIPVNMLRLQSNRLRKDFRYLVVGDDVDQCAIGAFLLAERGFDVAYVTDTLATIGAREPSLITRPPAADEATNVTVIKFPGAEMSLPDYQDIDGATEGRPHDPLDNTLTRIAGLSTYAEAKQAMHDTTPVDQFTDTASGRSLADIIDELEQQHDDLDGGDPTPSSLAPLEMDRDGPAAGASRAEAPRDAISVLLAEMETRLRREVAKAVDAKSALVAVEYQTKLARMREANIEEMRQKEIKIRESYAAEYHDKEQLVRVYYKKLIALANKISRQKAQLQEAKKQFEVKLASANQLYREVEEMRNLLSDQIVYMDEQALEDIPQLITL